MANFSEQQFLELLASDAVPDDIKQYFSWRTAELMEQYHQMEDPSRIDPGIRYLADHYANPTPLTAVRNAALSPYYSLSRFLQDISDQSASRILLGSVEETAPSVLSPEIDWELERRDAVAQAEGMTSNNSFGMLDDYYTTYIGTRLARQEGKDADLDYSVSKEYGDLRVLFEICKQKDVEPLFVHVPLHGPWSDYTGFPADRRQEYYGNVREIAEEYGVDLLDLTEYEYEEYFLCDVMHLGWRGWLEVDRALVDYYYQD